MEELMLRIDNVSKQYILGQIGGTTLRDELQRLSAKIRHKEDPTKKIGAKDYNKGEKFLALNGISFEVKKGERVGIIGHNGAGKSTLLKLISRVTAPSSGRILMNGRVASMLEVGTGFHPELTGRENIYMNGAILGMTKKEIDAKMEDIIEFSECRQFIDTPVKRYSSGMYVKLAFSVAAHLDSEIMIMDEVLAVGDMKFQKKCLEKMRNISKANGRTILYVSHNMETIRQLCNRCIVLNHGKVIYDGGVDDGIKLYLGNGSEFLPTFYDFSASRRPFEQHGHRIRLLSFEFLNKDVATYTRDEGISFGIKYAAAEDLCGLKLYFIIQADSGHIVGMSQSYESFNDVRQGHIYYSKLKMDFCNLAPGRYLFYVDIFSDDDVGNHWSYDHPMKMVEFEITEEKAPGLIWRNEDFGYVRLPPIVSIANSIIE